ncbi:MAG: hypothetical protein PF795_02070 [Kiritimatiellae bacterium]|nr:hypothetical protein [Kiritimatiellia bacterium]
MIKLHLFAIVLSLLISHISLARTEPVSITEYEADPGSVDAFVIQVFTLAYNEQYEDLEPFFSRTWKDWNSHRDPESAWRTVQRASQLSEIHMLPAQKSPVHQDVYYIRYIVFTQDGKRSGAELLVMEGEDGYKLAVQSNRSPVGNDYIQLGTKRNYVVEKLNALDAEIQEEDDNTLVSTMPGGDTFRLSFSPTTTELSGLQMLRPDQNLDLYLVIFDLEGTPTVKLKSEK